MNQKQREFLIDRVNKAHKQEWEKMTNKKPKPPSLNNYIIAAILDGSIKIKSSVELMVTIKDRVLNLDQKSNSFLSNSRNRWNDDDEEDEIFEIKAKEIFELPDAYKKAFDSFKEKDQAYKDEMEKLVAVRDTLILKINIGSDKILDKLIEEADNLADLTLMNARITTSIKELKS